MHDDISSRPTGGAPVAWEPTGWPSTGVTQSTPDLASLIQQVVDRDGRSAGNALALIISGTGGTRTAEAYDRISADAPLLEVVYLGAPAP